MKYVVIIVGLIVVIAGGFYGVSLLPSEDRSTGTNVKTIVLGDEVTLAIGEEVIVGGVTSVTLQDVLGDNRCPSDVECITAGDVQLELHFAQNNLEEIFRLLAHEETYQRAGVSIEVTDIAPVPLSTEVIEPGDYRITFLITAVAITSFLDCIAAGNPALESFPRQCVSGGETFVEDIGNSDEKQDLIFIATPRPNAGVVNIVDIHGQARGFWFFEGDFPIRLEDTEGILIAEGFGQAVGEWMTEDFVTFVTSIPFSVDRDTPAVLVFERDNPSDLPENDDELRLPIILKPGIEEKAPPVPQVPANVETESSEILNQGGSMEGHTPRGFQGSGTGLFVGDNLNSRFPNDDGVQIFLSFDVEALSEASSVVAATLSSSNTRVEGSPYTDLGNLIAQDISYNEFSSALWNHAVGDFSCTFATSQAGPFSCDVTEAVQTAIDEGKNWAQFRLGFENVTDGDGIQDLAMFFITNSNTNEPGIFKLNVTISN